MFALSFNDKSEIEFLKSEIESLRFENQQLAELKDNEVQYLFEPEDFGVDFRAMKAFSVERINTQYNVPGTRIQKSIARTEIGYFLNNEVKSWILYCSEAAHRELVRKFNEYVKLNESTPN